MVGKILIVDDVATNRIVMKVKLAAAGYVPLLAVDGKTCLQVARLEVPDLILLDLALPDMAGTDVLIQLRADPVLGRTPVVMFSASHAADARLRAFRAGADDFLLKPIDDQTLLARIRGLMRAREAVAGYKAAADSGFSVLGLAEQAATYLTPGQIALIVSKPETAMRLRRDLTARSPHTVAVMTKDAALAVGMRQDGGPDAFVIEADLATQGDGLRLLSELTSRTNTRHAAYSVMLGPQTSVAMAYDLGANDVVSERTPPDEIALRLDRLIRRKRESDGARASVQDGLRMAVIDPLTGLHNRRYGLAQLAAISEQALNAGSSFAVLVVDIDRFKTVNDRWGHPAGDAVLVEMANRLRANMRACDLLARVGGEEFLIALPETTLAEARNIAERLCLAIEKAPFTLSGDMAVPVTISIGLAISESGETPQHIDTVSEIFERADRALMHSKTAGRNMVTVSRTAA